MQRSPIIVIWRQRSVEIVREHALLDILVLALLVARMEPSFVSNTCAVAAAPCGASTNNNCALGATSSGGSSGTCIGGYTAFCASATNTHTAPVGDLTFSATVSHTYYCMGVPGDMTTATKCGYAICVLMNCPASVISCNIATHSPCVPTLFDLRGILT